MPRDPLPEPSQASVITTPDGRYIVVRERLWRATNPCLSAEQRAMLVRQLMEARRALRGGSSAAGRVEARRAVDAAKRALGERGPVWWSDGMPDLNRHLVRTTSYAAWFASLRNDDPVEPHAT